MPVIASGTQGCIVKPSLNGEPRMVSKIFVTERGHLSQDQEVYSDLLRDLQTIDPDRKQFAQALPRGQIAIDQEDIDECIRKIEKANASVRIVSEVRWFNLDDLQSAPEEFTRSQKDHLREALQLLHSAGWAHNDIHKPNIMMGSDALPRLIDFGECTQADASRIANDNDRLEGIFRESVLDITALRRSRLTNVSRSRISEDSPVRSALFQDSSPVRSALFQDSNPVRSALFQDSSAVRSALFQDSELENALFASPKVKRSKLSFEDL